MPCGAVRSGDWKLLEYLEDGRLELYNLKDDLGETTDLAGKLPDKARSLQAALARWRDSVGAQMPTRMVKETGASGSLVWRLQCIMRIWLSYTNVFAMCGWPICAVK